MKDISPVIPPAKPTEEHVDQTIAKYHRGLDIQKAIKLRAKGYTLDAIGQILGYSRQAVQQRIRRFLPYLQDPDAAQAFMENEGQIIDAVRFKSLNKIVDKLDDPRNTLRDLTINYGILFDKSQLKRGKATANIGHWTNLIVQAHQPSPKSENTPAVDEE